MFSRTVSSSCSPGTWGTVATSDQSSPDGSRGAPSQRIWPASARSHPPKMLSKVVLPDPDRPTTATSSCRGERQVQVVDGTDDGRSVAVTAAQVAGLEERGSAHAQATRSVVEGDETRRNLPHRRVVRRQHERGVRGVGQPRHDLEDLCGRDRVELGRRLVGQDPARTTDDR